MNGSASWTLFRFIYILITTTVSRYRADRSGLITERRALAAISGRFRFNQINFGFWPNLFKGKL